MILFFITNGFTLRLCKLVVFHFILDLKTDSSHFLFHQQLFFLRVKSSILVFLIISNFENYSLYTLTTINNGFTHFFFINWQYLGLYNLAFKFDWFLLGLCSLAWNIFMLWSKSLDYEWPNRNLKSWRFQKSVKQKEYFTF